MKAYVRMKFKEGMAWREQKTGGRELQRLSLCSVKQEEKDGNIEREMLRTW